MILNELSLLDDTMDIMVDTGEEILDSLIKNEALAMIPGVKIGVFLCKAGKGYADYRLKRKLETFLYECRDLEISKVEKFVQKNVKNEKVVGNLFLDEIYNLDHDKKARLAGRLYKYCLYEGIEEETYHRVLKAIAGCYFEDIILLKDLEGIDYYINTGKEIPVEVITGLFFAGFLNDVGIDGGGCTDDNPGGTMYALSEIGKIVVKLIY